MSGTAEETAAQAASVSAAAEDVSANSAVSPGRGSGPASWRSPATPPTPPSCVAGGRRRGATNETVLSSARARPRSVSDRVITSIASRPPPGPQRPSRRPGPERWEGFAVVANEVKTWPARRPFERGDRHKIETIQGRHPARRRRHRQITAIIGESTTSRPSCRRRRAAGGHHQRLGTSVTEAASGSTDIALNIIGWPSGVDHHEGAANTHAPPRIWPPGQRSAHGRRQFIVSPRTPSSPAPSTYPVTRTEPGRTAPGAPASPGDGHAGDFLDTDAAGRTGVGRLRGDAPTVNEDEEIPRYSGG